MISSKYYVIGHLHMFEVVHKIMYPFFILIICKQYCGSICSVLSLIHEVLEVWLHSSPSYKGVGTLRTGTVLVIHHQIGAAASRTRHNRTTLRRRSIGAILSLTCTKKVSHK